MTDLVVTLPKTVRWSDYQRELDTVKDRSAVMNFRLPSMPKGVGAGDRCYLVHDGRVVGWMEVVGVLRRVTCETTHVHWPAGVYLQRSGPFHFLGEYVAQKGFQGFHYAPSGWRNLPERPHA